MVGLGRVQTRPKARSEGVLGDPDPPRAFFGGPEQDLSKKILAQDPSLGLIQFLFPPKNHTNLS